MLKNSTNLGTECKNSPLILDTLGQVPPLSVKNLAKRARSKWYTMAIVPRLKYLDSPLKKYYSHAWNCNMTLRQNGKKLSGKYCDTRICHVCNRIRTGKMINGYLAQIENLGALEFVTLTRKNCTASELKNVVDDMLKKISLIIRNINEKLKIKISGIRKLEITYNAKDDTYHPHLHILVDKLSGKHFVELWLKREPNAQRTGWDKKKKKYVELQDYRPANKESLNEIFKYTSKILTHSKKGELDIYVNAIDTILIAMYKRRCFQSFGYIRQVNEDVDSTELNAQEYEDLEENFIEWQWKENDWTNTGKKLTNYTPPNLKFNFYE